MECKHAYFKYVDGVLVCSVCGKPADEIKQPAIEDKVIARPETKRIVPRDTGKIGGAKRR